MPLPIGSRLGPYEIEAPLGAGGMGEVYRARDTRLDRTVAIKVLPAELSADPDRRARFEREARAVAALSHPHICPLFDIGAAVLPDPESGIPNPEPVHYLVMEYVAGETLAARLRRGALPLAQALPVAIDIAEALAAAHREGVVHRDLKPGNVMLGKADASRQGSPQAKLLDFGLAKLREPGALGASGLTSVPTHEPATAAGTLLGTVPYMSPEQLEGKETDARSDIFAFGAVLYETLTGQRAFGGESQASIISAIMSSQPPPLSSVQPLTPPALDRLVQRCLAKSPDARWQTATDLADELRWIATGSGSVPGAAVPPGRRAFVSIAWPWLLAALVVLGVAATVAAWMALGGRRTGEWERFAEGRRLTRIGSFQEQTPDPAISRDGRTLCYVMQSADSRSDLYLGRIAGGARIQLTSDDAIERSPRFSPDGELVAFTRLAGADAKPEVRIVPSLGGEVTASIAGAAFPAWSPDGRRLAYVRQTPDGRDELVAGALDGASAAVILPADGVYFKLTNPSWSPDGRQVAVVRGMGGAAGEIWLVPSGGGAARRVLDEPATTWSDGPVFTPDGRGIVHSSNRGGATNLWVLPLDGTAPVRLTTGPGPDGSPSIAADGSIAFLSSRWRSLLQMIEPATGAARTLLAYSPYIWGPVVSPDGRDVAFGRSEEDGSWHIWAMPVGGGAARRLTSGEGGEIYARWSPDGRSVLFHSWNLPRRFGRVPREGGRTEWLSFGAGAYDAFADPAPDGRRVAFVRAEGQAERVYVAELGGGSPRLLTSSPGTVPTWSPDGARIAFSGSRAVTGGIFTIAADGSGERQLTRDGGWPVWWPDGKTIGYLAVDDKGNQQVRTVPAEGGTPRALTAIRIVGTNHPFAVTPDGRSIVITNAEHLADEIWLLKRER